MNILIHCNGADVTSQCMLKDTKITYDSSKRITIANLTIMGDTPTGMALARYDSAIYDADRYGLDFRDIAELYLVTIYDGRDGTTKLFEGQIYTIEYVQTDAPTMPVFYKCQLNDYATFLDRSVCWGGFALTMPMSDQAIIKALIGQFCKQIDATKDVAQIVPTVQAYDWRTKTCRQVLDDMKAISGGEWNVDFNAVLHYGQAGNAPVAPYTLSTSHDDVTSFQVNVSSYKHDFNNPINTAYVRGATDAASGTPIEASYSDPVSVQKYGVHSYGVVDDQIVTGYDASLRAKSLVLQYAYPVQSGNFTVWGMDWLKLGQQVHIIEDALGINGQYIIRQLTMTWVDQSTVQYVAQFGAAQPDLETVLRQLIQRTAWKTSNVPVSTTSPGPPPPGSVTDVSIAPPGLSAVSIQSINATTIQGKIQAGQIGGVNANTILGQLQASQINSVNAGAIVGTISAGQISSVSAGTIQGLISSGQIGSVSATTIQGVIVSSQLADLIIDNLAKYAEALRPIQMVKVGDPWPPTMPNKNFPPNSFFYYQPDGNFYQVNAAGTGWSVNNNPKGSLMSFYYIGAINAQSIIGLILAAQIQSITAGQITGQIQANQIQSVNVSSINGQISASQIGSVNASVIQGAITATQISSITAGQITGTIASTQIASITAGQITGSINYTQIGSINAATISIGQLQDSQIAGMSGAKLLVGSVTSDKFNGYSIDVGGLNNLPGRIRVFDGTGAIVGQIGYLGEVGVAAYGSWSKIFSAGGTSYATAPIYTDTAGNLHITNTNLSGTNISGGTLTDPSLNISGEILTSPTTFDATYSTLALKNKSATDEADFISRGLVIYANGTKVGSVVRSVSGTSMVAEFATGGAYVIIDGATGVRSDAGYTIGSNHFIDSGLNMNILGATIKCGGVDLSGAAGAVGGNVFNVGSVYCINAYLTGSINATGGFSGGVFTGQGVSCPAYQVFAASLRLNNGAINGVSTITASGDFNTTGVVYGGAAGFTTTCGAGSYYIGPNLVIDTGRNFVGAGVNVAGSVAASGFTANGAAGQPWTVYIPGGFEIAGTTYHYLYFTGGILTNATG